MSDGDIFIDEYQLLNVVASGNTTTVWEIVQKGGSQRLAMKILLPEAFKDSEMRSSLKHEARIGEKVEHPYLLRYHKSVFNRKHGYLVMDFFRALNLKIQLNSELVAIQARIRKLMESLCQVLGYLHDQGWIHHDIKPDNVLINKASEVRLIDFSLATRVMGALSKMIVPKKRVIQGTPTYIAPETLLKKVPTPQTDIYSLGVTIYEVLTGTPPFRGTNQSDLLKKHVGTRPDPPSVLNPNVTPDMDRLVLRMLAKKPADRHASMSEIYSEFHSLQPFKEDVMDVAARLAVEHEKKYQDGLNKMRNLDSRADADRTELYRTNPELAREADAARLAAKKPKKPAPPPPKEAQKPEPAPPEFPYQHPYPQPPQQMPMPYPAYGYGPPMMPPGYPQMPMYGQYPPPGQYPEQFPQGGHPMQAPPNWWGPGMPAPGMPAQGGPPNAQPGGPAPQPGAPPAQAPNQPPPAAPPAPQQTGQPVPPGQQPAQPPQQQPPAKPDEEQLPFMDELPPVE